MAICAVMSVQDSHFKGAPGANCCTLSSASGCQAPEPNQPAAVRTEPSTSAASHPPPASIADCATNSVPAKPPRGGKPNNEAMPTVCDNFESPMISKGTAVVRFAARSAAPTSPACEPDSAPNSAHAVCNATPAMSAPCHVSA